MSDFNAQLGDTNKLGFLSLNERLLTLTKNHNPFITGNALPANSGVFFGRDKELFEILSALRRPDKPSSVSVLGERRIGKSSLLNQVYQSLATEAGLVSIQTSTQNWNHDSAEDFYTGLKNAISTAVNLPIVANEIADFAKCRDFILSLAQDKQYRFVLLIDEFEKMSGNTHFDGQFFSHLRALADESAYRFGFVVASRLPLKDLCRKQAIEESKFWNIFGIEKVLGLLSVSQAQQLLLKPIECSSQRHIKEPEKCWHQFQALTGCHPLLIQLAGFDLWNSKIGGFELDTIALQMNLRRYMEDWFYQRSIDSKEEWQLLLKAAAKKTLPKSSTRSELVLRGLLNQQGELFCPYFAEVIEEKCQTEEGHSLIIILDDAEQGLEIGVNKVNALYELMMKGTKMAGKFRKSFLNPDDEDTEDN